MVAPPSPFHDADRALALDTMVGDVEGRLAALGQALQERNVEAIDASATELHRALSDAVKCFRHVAELGGVPEPMRRRLAKASAQVATQRESLARATAALDRAIDVLMPVPPSSASFYAATGHHHMTLQSGGLSA